MLTLNSYWCEAGSGKAVAAFNLEGATGLGNGW